MKQKSSSTAAFVQISHISQGQICFIATVVAPMGMTVVSVVTVLLRYPNAMMCKAYTLLANNRTCIEKISMLYTLGQKPTFYPEITKNLIFEKCEFCEK